MGVTTTILIIEVTVVAASGHRFVGDIQDRLQLMTNAEGVFCGFHHTDTPRQALGIDTSGDNLTTNLDHVVLDTAGIQHPRYGINTKAFGNSTTVEHHTGILFTDLTVGKGYLLIADDPAQTVYLMGGRHLLVPETEAPGIDQRCYGDVEGAFGIDRYLHCLHKHLDEIGIERHLTVLIDSRNHRLLVEW